MRCYYYFSFVKIIIYFIHLTPGNFLRCASAGEKPVVRMK